MNEREEANDRLLNGKTDWHNWMRDTMKIDPSDEKSIKLIWAVIGRMQSDTDALEAEKPVEDAEPVAIKFLDGLYYCGRVWEAWSAGTMHEDDFGNAAEDENIVSDATDAIQQYASSYHAKKCAECFNEKDMSAVKRMVDIVLGNESVNKELDSIAFFLGHHPKIIGLQPLPEAPK